MNFLQKLASISTLLIEAGPAWVNIHKLLRTIFPVCSSGQQKGWIFTNVKKQDWAVLHTEKLAALHANETIPVPKYKLLPEHYR